MSQIVRRNFPYTEWEPEALENWLEEQARDGLFLTDYSSVCVNHHKFERRTPAAARYRIQYSKEELSQSERDAYTDQGWDYLTRVGKANIFVTLDAHAPDLRRNWEDLAALRREARRKFRNNLLIAFGLLLFTLCTVIWSAFTDSTLDGLLTFTGVFDPYQIWFFLIVLVLIPVLPLGMLWQFARLPKETDPPLRPKPSRLPPPLRKGVQSGGWFFATLLSLFLLVLPFLPKPLTYSAATLTQSEWDALSYPLPQDPHDGNKTHVFRGNHFLAPSLIEIQQENPSAAVGDTYQLHIYQTRNEWIARWFVKDSITYFCHGADSSHDHTASLPPHDLDFAAYYSFPALPGATYSDTRHVLILRQGSTVVVEVDYDDSYDVLSLFPQYAAAITSA